MGAADAESAVIPKALALTQTPFSRMVRRHVPSTHPRTRECPKPPPRFRKHRSPLPSSLFAHRFCISSPLAYFPGAFVSWPRSEHNSIAAPVPHFESTPARRRVFAEWGETLGKSHMKDRRGLANPGRPRDDRDEESVGGEEGKEGGGEKGHPIAAPGWAYKCMQISLRENSPLAEDVSPCFILSRRVVLMLPASSAGSNTRQGRWRGGRG